MSSSSERQRDLHYRRAFWHEDMEVETLEAYMKQAHQKLGTPADRDFEVSRGDRVQGINFDLPKGGGILLHIGKYVPGEESSTIEKATKLSKQGKTGTQKAVAGSEFMDGDVFCYVKGNHVCLLPSGAREGTALKYLQRVMKYLEKTREARYLKLIRVAKIDVLQMLRDEGIKEISMKAGLYDASLIRQNKTETNLFEKGIAMVSEALGSVVFKDKKTKEIRDLENLNVEISVSFDGKTAQHKRGESYGQAGQDRLIELAGDILDDDSADEFVIITRKGKRVTSSQIAVKEPVKLTKEGKSVVPSEAWEELLSYYKKLKKLGALEQ